MAAPLYTQGEADAMLAMPKGLAGDGFASVLRVRPTNFEHVSAIDLLPLDEMSDRVLFGLEIRIDLRTYEVFITLRGQLDKRGWQGLCGYDFHRIPHSLKPPCTGADIPANVVHTRLPAVPPDDAEND